MSGIKVLLPAAALFFFLGTTAHAFCFNEAGQEYGINPQILRAIAKVESNFNPAAVNVNSNGTYDFGLMQINSSWASVLGKERWQAQGDACYNTKTGAWILSMCMKKYGYTWKAIGCYNSQTPDKRDRYSRMVFNQIQKVHPLEQERAYSSLKDQLEDVVRNKADGWVEKSVKDQQAEFGEKNPPALPAKKSPSEVPVLDNMPLQSAQSVPQGSLVPQASQPEPEISLQ